MFKMLLHGQLSNSTELLGGYMKRQFILITGIVACIITTSTAAGADCTSLLSKLQDGQTAHATDVTNYIFNCPNFTSNVGIGTTTPGTHLSLGGTGTGPTIYTYEYGNTVRGFANDLVPANLGGWEFDIFAPDNSYGAGGTVIGKMSADGNRNFTPYLTVRNTGRIGIGTTQPLAKLDVAGDESSVPTMGIQISDAWFPEYIMKATAGAANAKIWRMIGRGSNDFQLQTLDDSYGGEVTALQIIRNGTSITNVTFPNGNVGIGTTTPGFRLDVNGTIAMGGVALSTSDRRLKTDITPIAPGVLTWVMALNPVTYRWKNPKDGGMQGIQMGLIAQDVERILPTAVLTAHDAFETKSIKYNELTVVLIKAVQEQQSQIAAQQKQITALRNQIMAIHAENVRNQSGKTKLAAQ